MKEKSKDPPCNNFSNDSHFGLLCPFRGVPVYCKRQRSSSDIGTRRSFVLLSPIVRGTSVGSRKAVCLPHRDEFETSSLSLVTAASEFLLFSLQRDSDPIKSLSILVWKPADRVVIVALRHTYLFFDFASSDPPPWDAVRVRRRQPAIRVDRLPRPPPTEPPERNHR